MPNAFTEDVEILQAEVYRLADTVEELHGQMKELIELMKLIFDEHM